MISNLKYFLAVCTLALVSLTPTLAHATNIVANGDFALGSTDWTYNSSTSYPWSFANNGTNTYASTGCVGQPCITGTPSEQAFLYQDLATTLGDSYTLSFDFQGGAGTPQELQALFGGAVVEDILNIPGTTLVTYTVSGLVATSTTTEVEFLGRQDPAYDALTNVSVVDDSPSAVPEPGTIAMVGTGLLSLFGVARRRFC